MATGGKPVLSKPTMTTLLIGPDKRKYVVRKDRLCKKLGYFRAAYKTPMAEPSNNVFEINDVPDQAFGSLIRWVNTGKVVFDPANGEPPVELVRPTVEPFQSTACTNAKDIPLSEGSTGACEFSIDTDFPLAHDAEDDYEFDSGSEPEDDGNDDASKTVDLVSIQNTSEQDQELVLVRSIFPDSQPSELDEYQLGVLIQIHSSSLPWSDARFVPKWKIALAQKESMAPEGEGEEDEQAEPDMYDFLVDLYILADRFDAPKLCTYAIDLLEKERTAQAELLGGQPPPSFQTVTKAFENQTAGSRLRHWFLYAYAYYWRPSGDSPEQAAARELLPKDFLLELALTSCERNHFTVGAENVASWKHLYIDHDYVPVVTFDPVWNNQGR